MFNHLNNKGLTLIEVLLSITILAIVSIPILNFFTQSYKLNKQNEIQFALHTESVTYFEKIKTAVAEGIPLLIELDDTKKINIPSQFSCKNPYNETIYSSFKKTNHEIFYSMTIKITAYNAQNSPEFSHLLQSIDYYLEPDKLFKIELELIPTNANLHPIQLQVIKLSKNGCET